MSESLFGLAMCICGGIGILYTLYLFFHRQWILGTLLLVFATYVLDFGIKVVNYHY